MKNKAVIVLGLLLALSLSACASTSEKAPSEKLIPKDIKTKLGF